MTDQLTDLEASLRCSSWTRRLHVDPIGTAGSYNGFLLVEWPLPWPRDVGMIEELAPVVAALAGTGIRLQALVPSGAGGQASATLFLREPGEGFGRYLRRRIVAPLAQLPAAAVALLAEGVGDGGDGEGGIDVLVCTHGRRDRCCGSSGTLLAGQLAADQRWAAEGVRVWRTSHTGGHRFAPTAIVLPQGTMWAYASEESLHKVVAAEGDPGDLLATYRGCAGIGSPRLQAMERAVLAQTGWSLLSARRRGEDLGAGRVALEVTWPGGSTQRWEATVTVTRQVPVPECGSPIEAATKFDDELAVEGLTPAG